MDPYILCFDVKQVLLTFLSCKERLSSQRVSKNWHFFMSCHPLPQNRIVRRCFPSTLGIIHKVYVMEGGTNICFHVHEISQSDIQVFTGKLGLILEEENCIFTSIFHWEIPISYKHMLQKYCIRDPFLLCHQGELILHCYKQKNTYIFSLQGKLKTIFNNSFLMEGDGPFCADRNYLFGKKDSTILLQSRSDENKKWKFTPFPKGKANVCASFALNEKDHELYVVQEHFIHILSYGERDGAPQITYVRKLEQMMYGEILDIVYCEGVGVLALLLTDLGGKVPDAIVIYTRNGEFLGYVCQIEQMIEDIVWSGNHLYARTAHRLFQFSIAI